MSPDSPLSQRYEIAIARADKSPIKRIEQALQSYGGLLHCYLELSKLVRKEASIKKPIQYFYLGSGRSLDIQFLDAVPELAESQPEQFGCSSFVVAGFFQRDDNGLALNVINLVTKIGCCGHRGLSTAAA